LFGLFFGLALLVKLLILMETVRGPFQTIFVFTRDFMRPLKVAGWNWFALRPVGVILPVVLAWMSVSCASARFAQLDTSQPGWRVSEGEVTWKPGGRYAEMVGEIVWAHNGSGEATVEFSKAMVPLVTAQVTASGWQIEFNGRSMNFSGRGPASARFGWLQLPAALEGRELPKHWRFSQGEDGFWTLENSRSGERLTGHLRLQ
jgi:hypothetical protein